MVVIMRHFVVIKRCCRNDTMNAEDCVSNAYHSRTTGFIKPQQQQHNIDNDRKLSATIHTRCDQKLLFFLNFSRKHSFVPFNPLTSLKCISFLPAFFQYSKHFWNSLFCIANSLCFGFSFISSIIAKLLPYIYVFSFGKRSDEYGV